MRLSVLGKADDDETHQDSVWTCAWSPKSDLLVTGSVDESVNVYHELDGKVKRHHNYSGHTLGVISVDVDPSGEFAASSALDSFIRVWSLQDHITKDVIETPPSETWSICFNPTSDTLQIAAAGGSSNGVSLYNCDGSGTPVSTMSLPAVRRCYSACRIWVDMCCIGSACMTAAPAAVIERHDIIRASTGGRKVQEGPICPQHSM